MRREGELETFIELAYTKNVQPSKDWVYVSRGKATAIEWIKELYTNRKYYPNDKHGDERDSITWIKNFFNITESDLK